ncbi:MAG: rhomboid family intramembrane serine protease [Candidatus Zipacnadales bacterium]
MIPLRDNIRSRTPPLVSYTILGVCVFVHFLQQVSHLQNGSFLLEWALVPRYLVSPVAWAEQGFLHILATLFTSQFLHGDVLHLTSNMIFLWVFSDNVEDRLGHGRFLVFYLLCGACAGLAQSILSWFPETPMLGASGSIAGVLGAYFVLFRGAWIRSLWVFFVIPFLVDIPAVVFIGLWFVVQTLSALYSLGPVPAPGNVGIAFIAHVGGFVAGILLLRLLLPPTRRPHLRVVRRPPQPRIEQFRIY